MSLHGIQNLAASGHRVAERNFQPVLEWIDCELSESGLLPSSQADLLLELRQTFAFQSELLAFKAFYKRLGQLEKSHFLLSYRVRHWFALNFQIEVFDVLDVVPSEIFPISATHRNFRQELRRFFEFAPEVVPMDRVRLRLIRRK